MLSVYDGATKETYDDSDKEALNDLMGRLGTINPKKSNWDKIQWMQIDYLKFNLSKFITNYDNHMQEVQVNVKL